jgi:hypothetical protein
MTGVATRSSPRKPQPKHMAGPAAATKRKKVSTTTNAAGVKRKSTVSKVTKKTAEKGGGDARAGQQKDQEEVQTSATKKVVVHRAGKRKKLAKSVAAPRKLVHVEEIEESSFEDPNEHDDDESVSEDEVAIDDNDEDDDDNGEDEEDDDDEDKDNDDDDDQGGGKAGRTMDNIDVSSSSSEETPLKMSAKKAVADRLDSREVLNRSAQKGTANPPSQSQIDAAASLHRLGLDVDIPIRGMSKTESLKKRQSHVAKRIMLFVKTDVFRRIKFINNDEMFRKAFQLVIRNEDVPPNKRFAFQQLYESAFNHALNTKRGSCEQAGGFIVRKALAEFQERGEEFFTFDEFCKLRRAETVREHCAFLWFFASFLECVCGARSWREGKKTMLISEATDGTGEKLVTKSDEAFGLLLIDNYMEKWRTIFLTENANASTQQVQLAEGDVAGQVGKKTTTKIVGKYTVKKSGHCKYGGWSREGTARFNQLYNLVQEDRASAKCQEMELKLLAFCQTKKAGEANTEGGQGENSGNVDSTESLPVEAAWDLDD